MTKRARRSRASKGSSPKSDGFGEACSVIRRGRRFLVATHRNPDGDALGSALALASGLKRLGKTVRVYNGDPVPPRLRFLPRSGSVSSALKPGDRFDAAFIVDCSEFTRVGEPFQSHKGLGTVVVLDHHAHGLPEGNLRLVDVRAASSGMVVYRLLRRLGVPLTKDIAVNLYVTLATDTGHFRYENVSAEVLELAGRLVRAGARPGRISRALLENATAERLRLLARVLGTLELTDEGRIAVIHVTRAMMKKTNTSLDMTDDFVDLPRSIGQVEAVAFFRQVRGGWRVSLRSKSPVDVGAVAVRLGGGGHVRAAGFTKRGDFASVSDRTMALLRRAIRKSSIYKRKSA